MTILNELKLLALGTRLRVLSEHIMAIVKGYYAAHDLPFEPRWFPLFSLLKQTPDISPLKAAKALGISHAAVNSLMKSIQVAGFIDVTDDPIDGRAKCMRLNARGNILSLRMKPAWFALEKALNSTFSDPEVVKVLAFLDHLDGVVKDHEIERSLKAALNPKSIIKRLKCVAYDAKNYDHRGYFEALNTEWLEQYFRVEPSDQKMFADPYASIIEPGGFIYMALVDDQIVGTGAVISREAGRFELAKMAVSRVFQGKGIGAKLVNILCDEAKARGIKIMHLVSSTSLPHAVPMYKKLGFVKADIDLHTLYERSDITLMKRLDL
jgi:putative acetyltransferase